MSDPSFRQTSDQFLSWFKSLPGATFHPDLRIQDLRERNAGRGIVATSAIEANTVLFTIPHRYTLSVATSALASHIPQIREDSSCNPWTSLILVLMYESLRRDRSPWRAYLDLLPADFDTPMFWPPADLAELQASSLVSRIGRTQADATIRSEVLPIIRQHSAIFFKDLVEAGAQPDDEELMGLAHRMASSVMAYAFDMNKDAEDNDDDDDEDDEDEGDEDEQKKLRQQPPASPSSSIVSSLSMIPMADLLNADAEFNAYVNLADAGADDDDLTVLSLRPIPAGTEVLNYYGPHPNSELLRRYGYVTLQHARFDVVELPWALVATRLRRELGCDSDKAWAEVVRQAKAKAEGGELEDSFVLERGGEDPNGQGMGRGVGGENEFVPFLGLPDELEEQIKCVIGVARTVVPGVREVPGGKEAKKRVLLGVVLGALQDRLAQYATSLDEDLAILERQRPGGRLEKAVVVRMGEKVVLKSAMEWVRGRLAKLGVGERREEHEEGPAPKRRQITG